MALFQFRGQHTQMFASLTVHEPQCFGGGAYIHGEAEKTALYNINSII